MTDREMLLFVYGAIKATSYTNQNLRDVVSLVEEHLYPPKIEDALEKDENFYKHLRPDALPVSGPGRPGG